MKELFECVRHGLRLFGRQPQWPSSSALCWCPLGPGVLSSPASDREALFHAYPSFPLYDYLIFLIRSRSNVRNTFLFRLCVLEPMHFTVLCTRFHFSCTINDRCDAFSKMQFSYEIQRMSIAFKFLISLLLLMVLRFVENIVMFIQKSTFWKNTSNYVRLFCLKHQSLLDK